MQNQQLSDGKIKLSGLWKKTSQNGEEYLGATLKNGARISVFKNKSKRKGGEPDYDLVISKLPKKKTAQKPAPAPRESGVASDIDILAAFGIDGEELRH